ncbi:hypothetical protein [Streptomyces sp. NPDC005385]|uniref:hypothetical protein n=1 Tax=Streptomyces sp. NPDC005385 TaxID=3157039 RepID=UPI0033A79E05
MTSPRRTRRPRIVCLLLALHSVWSAWCACQQYLYGNLPVTAAFVAGSFIPLVALVLQNELADLHDALRFFQNLEATQRASPLPGGLPPAAKGGDDASSVTPPSRVAPVSCSAEQMWLMELHPHSFSGSTSWPLCVCHGPAA